MTARTASGVGPDGNGRQTRQSETEENGQGGTTGPAARGDDDTGARAQVGAAGVRSDEGSDTEARDGVDVDVQHGDGRVRDGAGVQGDGGPVRRDGAAVDVKRSDGVVRRGSGMFSARIGPAERSAALARMADPEQELDVIVVGGGVVGSGVALDAVTRGLSVGLVEARDFASGTSSRSSKLIHGGLRYLEQLNFDLVREALQERALLLQRIAPHLVRPVPFLFPLTHHVWERPYVGAGLTLYDTLGFSTGLSRGVPGHRHLSRRRALRLAPALRKSSLTGAVQYWDAQVDDARHVATMLRTAAAYGAQVASRTKVVRFLREGERVTGVRVRDLETGNEFDVRAPQRPWA
jgi:glycerol-3-phosphate dehydrogenase